MSAKIIRIPQEKPLPHRTIKASSMYRRKAQALSSDEMDALHNMERKFHALIRTSGKLYLKESKLIRGFEEAKFTGADGTIYYFLKNRNSVVLLDFELSDTEGGGQNAGIEQLVMRGAARAAPTIPVAARRALRLAVTLRATPLFSIRILCFGLARADRSAQQSNTHQDRVMTLPSLFRPALSQILYGRAFSNEKAKHALFGKVTQHLSAYLGVQEMAQRKPTAQIDTGSAQKNWSLLSYVTGEREIRETESAERILFNELVSVFSVCCYMRQGGISPRPRWSILSQLADEIPLTSQHVKQILFGKTISVLSALLGIQRTAAARHSAPSILARIADGAPLSEQHEKQILFGEMVGTLSTCLRIDSAGMPPRPTWSILSTVANNVLTGPQARQIVFSEIVRALSAYVDRTATKSIPTWSILYRIDAGAPLTRQHVRQVLFGETVSTLSAYLDIDHTVVKRPRAWSFLSRIGGDPIAELHTRRLLFVESVGVLSAYLDLDNIPTPRPPAWSNPSQITDDDGLLAKQKGWQVLFGEAVSALSTCLDNGYNKRD